MAPPTTRSAELDAEVSWLKAKFAMMEVEQARLREGAVRAAHSERMSDEAPSIAGIPPMPHHAEEVEQWLIDRNCELRSALHYQDTHMIAHIGALIAKLSTVEAVEEQSRSSLMAALISEADAKRRCIDASPYPSMVGNHVSYDVRDMDFEECESGRLRTLDRGCFADIEDQVEVLWLSLRMMMRRCSLTTEMWSHGWKDPCLCQTSFRHSRFDSNSTPAILPLSCSQLPEMKKRVPCLMRTSAHLETGRIIGESPHFAEPAFRRLRLISQGTRVPHVSGSVGAVDESVQDAFVRGSDRLTPFQRMKRVLVKDRPGKRPIALMVGRNQWKEMMQWLTFFWKIRWRWIFQEQQHPGEDLSFGFGGPTKIVREQGLSLPQCGPFRNALKFALEKCISLEVLRQERGWKLLTLIPRMLLRLPPGGGLIPKSKMLGRFEVFSRGEFNVLLMSSEACDEKAAVSRRRRHRTGGLDLERRALRAETLIQWVNSLLHDWDC